MYKIFLPVLMMVSLHLKAQQQTTVVKLTHYALDAFSDGVVKMKSGESYAKMLNYNILTGEIIFMDGSRFLALEDPKNVDTVTIAGRKFIPGDKMFYELLTNTALPLLLEYTYTIKEPGTSIGYGLTTTTSAASALRDFIQTGGAYALKLPDNFQVIPGYNYWIRKEGKYLKVSNAQSLSKIFPDQKDRIKELVKTNHTDFGKREEVALLVQQVEQ